MVVLLLGAPGSGKGTQSKFLMNALKIPHLSTGDMLRNAVRERTTLGIAAEAIMKAGGLVPDSLVVDLLNSRIAAPDCVSGFILDGFPRNLAQASSLDKALLEGEKKVDVVVVLELDFEVIVSRLTGRRSCVDCGTGFHIIFKAPTRAGICDQCSGKLIQREDDSESVIRQRLKVYQDQTSPLIDHYRKKGLLVVIDGKGVPDEITGRILHAIRSSKH